MHLYSFINSERILLTPTLLKCQILVVRLFSVRKNESKPLAGHPGTRSAGEGGASFVCYEILTRITHLTFGRRYSAKSQPTNDIIIII